VTAHCDEHGEYTAADCPECGPDTLTRRDCGEDITVCCKCGEIIAYENAYTRAMGLRPHPKLHRCPDERPQWYVVPCPNTICVGGGVPDGNGGGWRPCPSCNGKGIVKVRASLDDLEEMTK